MSAHNDPNGTERHFASKLYAARKSARLSQSVMADRMRESGFPNYYQQTVTRNETGKRSIPLGEALVLASILGVSIEGSSVLSYEDGYRAGINAARESLAALN